MKKEVMDILQNGFVFGRLSGSAGNITAVNMGDKHYFREKGKTECPNTEHQQTYHQVLRRGVAAWQSLDIDKQEQWNRLGEQVRPFNEGSRLSGYNLFMSCYLQLASTGHKGIPEPGSSPVNMPDLSLELTVISESDSSTLNIECKATPAIPDRFCINARIKVHAYGYDCNPGYKLNCCGKSDDGCHVTFNLQDYRRSFNIGTLDRREVFVRIEYDLVDMQPGLIRILHKVGDCPINEPLTIFFATAGLMTAKVDGKYLPSEKEQIVRQLASTDMYPMDVLQDFESIPDEQVLALFEKSVNEILNYDFNMRANLLSYIIHLAIIDKKLDEKEINFIYNVGDMMKFTVKEISRIFANMIQRNYIPSLESIC